MKLLRSYFRIMDQYLPGLAARQVYHFMSNPRVHKLKDFESEILDTSDRETVNFKNFSIQLYKWGNPANKTAFLIHGWEGHAGNFGAIIESLLAQNYHVIAFDGPSHGASSKGKTSMFDFADLVTEFIELYAPSIVVSHSFGSVTAAIALSRNQDIPIDKWVAITTPNNFKDRLADIAQFLNLTNRTMNKVIPIVESQTEMDLDTMNMDHYGKFLDHVNDVLIVHSKSDKILPIRYAREAHDALPNSRLIELDQLGHYSILWSKQLKTILNAEFSSSELMGI